MKRRVSRNRRASIRIARDTDRKGTGKSVVIRWALVGMRARHAKEAKAERLAPRITQEQTRVQEGTASATALQLGVKQTHKRAHAR